MTLVQMCVQGLWQHDSSLLALPFFEEEHIALLNKALKRGRGRGSGVETVECLPELLAVCEKDSRFLHVSLQGSLQAQEIAQVSTFCHAFYRPKLSLCKHSCFCV